MRVNLLLLTCFVLLLGLSASLERDTTQPGFAPLLEGQMGHSPAFHAFEPNPNFADGLTLRLPPSGTIARGQMPLPYQATPEDAVRAGLELKNPFSVKDERRVARGEAVFNNFCQVCHGPLGWGDGPVTQGGFPPPPSLLADRALSMPDGQMFHILAYGQGRMPAINAQLSADDRWCALLHVRELQRFQSPSEKPVPMTLDAVATLFRQNCSACHGPDGSGNIIRKSLPNIPDFTNLAWQVAQTEMAIVNQIDYGSLPLMPAFRYKLTREQIQGLAVYVRSFAGRAGATAPLVTSAHISPVDVYQTYCFACHDTNGRGNPTMRNSMKEIPDFTLAAWQDSRSDAELSHSIMQGKGKFMLPMKDKLGPVNASEMVALIRKFRDGKQEIALAAPKPPGPPPAEKITGPVTLPPAVTPPANEPVASLPLVAPSNELAARIRTGAVIFRQYCIICHGPDGTGSIMRASMPPIPNFSDSAWHEGKTDSQLQVSILEGKGTLMPANNGRITPDQARDLVAYIRAFGPRVAVSAPAGDSAFTRSFRQLQRQWEELEKELQKSRAEAAR